ncbi:MAG: DUF4097 family beta strand repeat protein [Clostridia bacterium]|nr:DUF4097 family beta strand repeat protein [Clostridia bacterium]
MKKGFIISLIVAASLLVAGVVTGIVGLCLADFKLGSSIQEKTVTLTDAFDKIVIDVDTSDVKILPSDNGKSCVMLTESANPRAQHTVSVTGGVLNIKMQDTRRWYEHIGVNMGKMSVTVYLAKTDFLSINVDTDTGDVTVPKGFAFENASVESDTGDIEWAATVSGKLEIGTDTGDIRISGIAGQRLEIESDTGAVTVADASTSNGISVETDTGDVKLTAATTAGRLSVKTATGNVTLTDCDGGSMLIKTSTGDVSGTLLSPKDFDADSGTGKVKVPQSSGDNKCEIRSSTGNINISIKK